MSVTTVRISPPKPPKKRRAKKAAPTPSEELGRFFRNTRVAWIPFGISLWWGLITAAIAHRPDAYMWYAVGFVVCEIVLWWKGHVIGAIRPIERRYAFALPVVGALWSTYATFGDGSVSLHDVGALVCLTVLSASPWWRHRRNRGTVPISFIDTDRIGRNIRLREARRLMNGWTAYTSAGHIQGARVRFLEFSEWSVSIGVRLRNGASAQQLQHRGRRNHLESASLWPVAPGSLRIHADDHDSRNCVIRYMLKDPHAEAIIPDAEEQPTIDNTIIGKFETGADVLFSLVNTLIAGETGAGKSILVNRLIQIFAKIPVVGLLGVDLTPGATELGSWRGVLHELADDPDRLDRLFDAIIDEMYRRGRIMEQNRWKVFRCTVADPFMVLIIDEAQNVKALRLDKKLSKICAEIRKYGGCVIVATQYPTAPNLPATITNNLPQKIGMKVTSDVADRVIFGGSASRNGWSPSVLIPDGRKGSFLIRNEHYGKPLLARCHYVSETDVERDNERFAPVRTPIPTISLQGISATHTREQLEPGNVAVLEREDEAEEIFDAEVLDNTESIILDLIDRQVNTPTKIQPELESFGIQLTTRSIIRHLKSMKERNLIYQSRKQGPWFRRS